MKIKCGINNKILDKIFSDKSNDNLTFIKDIKYFKKSGLKNYIFISVLNVANKKDVLKYYELFYDKLGDNIKFLYKIKAKKLNLMNLYKKYLK